MANKLSSTNIAEILEAQIEAIKKVNDVIVNGNIDQTMLKNVVDTVKPIGDTIKILNDISQQMGSMKIANIIGTAKFKMGIQGLVSNIKYIAQELATLDVDKKSTEKVKAVCDNITLVSKITGDLMIIGTASIVLVIMKSLIIKTMKMLVEISKQMSEMQKVNTKAVIAIGDALASLGKSLLVFVLTTMGGIVPLIAIISLLAVKAFLWVFLKLFGKSTQIKLKSASVTIGEMAKVMIVLSMTILLWALIGVLIAEEWKNILITITFVFLAVLLFTFLGEMISLIKNGQASIKQISITLIMLSMTVLLWALMGDLIVEEWKSILITMSFVVGAIALFAFLGFAMKFIKSGEQSLLKLSLTFIILSLTVLLWALTGDLIMEEWASILMMTGFVLVAIGVMVALSFASKFIQDGGKSVLMLSVALAVLSVDVFLMAAAGKALMENWLPILLVMVFVGVIIGICALLTYFSWAIEPGVLILKGIAIALVLVAASFLIFGITCKLFDEETCENMRNMFKALIDSMVYAGLRIPFLILGSVGIAIMSAAMLILAPTVLVLALALKVIKSNGINAADAAAPIDLILSVVNAVNSRIGWRMMWRIAKATFKIMLLIPLAIALGVITRVIASIAALKMPTKFDKDGNATEFQKMTPDDFAMAAANAAAITGILANMFGDEDFEVEAGGQTIKIKAIKEDALKGITFKTMIKMMMLNNIVRSIGRMASTLANVASLIVPDETAGFDKDGNPKGWRKMTTRDFVMAGINVAMIITTLLGAMTVQKFDFLGGKTVMDAVEDMSYWAIIKMGKVLETFGHLEAIVSVVQQMAQMSVPTKWNSEGKAIAFRTLTPEERQAAVDNTVVLMTEFLSAISSPQLSVALSLMSSKATENFATIMGATAGVKDLIEAIQKSTELDEEKTVTGISNMKAAIERYVGMLYELFVETWEFQYTPKKIWGITVPWWSWVKVKDAIINVKQMKQAVEKMQLLTQTMEPLKSLIDGIKELSTEDNVKEAKTGIKTLKEIVEEYCKIFTGDEKGNGGVNISATGEKKFERFKELIEYHDKFSKINAADLSKTTDNFVKFVDKANSIDESKIKSVRDMFEQMARFSESVSGNFDKLAEVLNNELIEILEKLNDTLIEIKDKPMPTQKATSATQTAPASVPGQIPQPQAPQQAAQQAAQKEKRTSSSIEQNIANIKSILERFEQAGWGIE